MNTELAGITQNKVYDLTGIDLYGCTIHLVAQSKAPASLGKIIIYGTDNPDSTNSYNSHIRLGDEEIATCGNIEVTIQNDYVNDNYTVCY